MNYKIKISFLMIFYNIYLFLYSNNLSLRDPFSYKIENVSKNFYDKTDDDLKVLAISMVNEKNGVILQNGKQQEVVFVGDEIWGYKVVKIDLNEVVILSEDKKFKTLYLEDVKKGD